MEYNKVTYYFHKSNYSYILLVKTNNGIRIYYAMQKQPSCKKEARPSKVESYLKDECMVWLTTRNDT